MILTLAGTPKNVVANTLTISQNMTYTIDTMKAAIQSDTEPVQGSEVIVTEGAERMFAGVVRTATLVDAVVMWWAIDCDDYTALIDRKIVIEEYSNQSATAIVNDIITKYITPDFNAAGVVAGAPSIEFIQFNYKRPSECFKAICDYVGWQWYVDYDKTIRFFSAESMLEPAPLELTEANRYKFDNIEIKVDSKNVRNRVFVRGGTMLSSAINLEFKYDGKMRAWMLPYKPSELKIYVSEVLKTVGIENIDAPSTVDFLLNYQEQRISMGDSFTSPAEGATIRQNFKHPIDVITVVEDLESQAAIAAIQGGDGVYEHEISDNTIVTLEAAEAIGNKDIREFGNPAMNGSADTRETGWNPGQLFRISLQDRGIDNTYMVQSVDIKRQSNEWVFTPRFGGRLFGISDFLQALVSKQQKSESKTEVLQKYTYVNEAISITDSLITAARTGHWVCGDTDAICGEVVCLA